MSTDDMFVVDSENFTVPDHTASDGHKAVDTPSETGKDRLRRMLVGGQPKPTARKRKSPPPPNKPGKYVEPLTAFYIGVGVSLMPFNPEFGMTMLGPCRPPTDADPSPPSVAADCARAWDEVAQRNETVRRALETFMMASVWGILLTAHAPLLAAALKGTPLGQSAASSMDDYLRAQRGDEAD